MAQRSKSKPNLIYQVMDMFNMTFKPGWFNAILDKGALDAVFPEKTRTNIANVTSFFTQI
jgi:hypothetical protein